MNAFYSPRLVRASLPVILFAGLTGFARADDTASSHLLGDWNGQRTKLADQGVTLSISNIFDAYDNVGGGNGDTFIYFDRQRIDATIDLQKLAGWQGAELYLSGVGQYGRNNGKRDIGLYTNPSGIEGKRTTRLAEFWLQQKLWDDKLAIKVGKLDGVGEFGLQDYGSTFMNDELGYVPNAIFGAGMPFDPAGKPGVVVTLQPFTGDLAGLYAKAGVFAGNDNNAYAHDENGFNFGSRGPTVYGAELGYKKSGDHGALPGIYKIGVHYNDGTTANLATPTTTYGDNTLVYLNANQTLTYLDDARQRHVDAAFTVSAAPGNRNANELEFTALIRVIGPLASRPMDEAGIGFISSKFSDEASTASVLAGGPSLDRESTVELAYKARVTPWFTVQPDVQVVFDPAGDTSRGNVLILGLRTIVDF